MKTKLYQDWLAALFDGKYKQGQNRLFDGDTYCCMGVLCDIAGLKKVQGNTLAPEHRYGFKEDAALYFTKPPKSLGLSAAGIAMLTRFNDEYMLTFAQIATEIFNNPKAFLAGDLET